MNGLTLQDFDNMPIRRMLNFKKLVDEMWDKINARTEAAIREAKGQV